jgi:hypothetical protein
VQTSLSPATVAVQPAQQKKRQVKRYGFADGIVLRMALCKRCDMFRPPKATHCSVCGNCVRDLDHHCPWLGVCIGQNNLTAFVVLIVIIPMLAWFQSIMSGVWLAHSIYQIMGGSGEVGAEVVQYIAIVAASSVGLFICCKFTPARECGYSTGATRASGCILVCSLISLFFLGIYLALESLASGSSHSYSSLGSIFVLLTAAPWCLSMTGSMVLHLRRLATKRGIEAMNKSRHRNKNTAASKELEKEKQREREQGGESNVPLYACL